MGGRIGVSSCQSGADQRHAHAKRWQIQLNDFFFNVGEFGRGICFSLVQFPSQNWSQKTGYQLARKTRTESFAPHQNACNVDQADIMVISDGQKSQGKVLQRLTRLSNVDQADVVITSDGPKS